MKMLLLPIQSAGPSSLPFPHHGSPSSSSSHYSYKSTKEQLHIPAETAPCMCQNVSRYVLESKSICHAFPNELFNVTLDADIATQYLYNPTRTVIISIILLHDQNILIHGVYMLSDNTI